MIGENINIYPMMIGGEQVTTAKSFPVLNPATETIVGYAPVLDNHTVQQVLTASETAFQSWRNVPLKQRQELMRHLAVAVDKERDNLIDLLIAETGKDYDNAVYDFEMIGRCLTYFAEEAARLRQDVVPDAEGRFLHYLIRQPRGVVVAFVSWNFPLLNLAYKLGPILASGCTGIISPSPETPLTTLTVGSILHDAGLPAGVINIVTTDDYQFTNQLIESPIPAMVTMIGSTAVGRHVIETSAKTIKQYSMELGGDAPVIVYPDADVQLAAEKIVALKLTNAGQVCVSPNRCFVHESVYEEFIAHAKEQTKKVTLGAGKGEGPRMGPLMSKPALDRITNLIERAITDGAQVVVGGKSADSSGFFLEPTILRDVKSDMQLTCDEIFGPVLPIIPFNDADDIIAMANDTSYGLAAYVFTSSLSTALKASEEIEAGSVCINEPFYDINLPHGGIKQSGIGKDLSPYSLEEYMTLKRVSILK